jgi:AcrR family transcriptional regulator
VTRGEAHVADGRRHRADGRRSRRRILETAARLATVEGLDGLSIGRLAAATGMSKGGVYAHFGSKEDLQLATIDMAREIFVGVVVRPANAAPKGVDRLREACARFLDHVDKKVFPGGCFFASVAAEMSARPGAVRDRIGQEQRAWVALLERYATEARRLGQLPQDADPAQLAFELNALVVAANTAYVLHGDRTGLQRAVRAIDDRLGVA